MAFPYSLSVLKSESDPRSISLGYVKFGLSKVTMYITMKELQYEKESLICMQFKFKMVTLIILPPMSVLHS